MKNKNGMSLVEVMISLGIMGLMFTYMMQMQKMNSDQMKAMNARLEEFSFKDTVKGYFENETSCRETLGFTCGDNALAFHERDCSSPMTSRNFSPVQTNEFISFIPSWISNMSLGSANTVSNVYVPNKQNPVLRACDSPVTDSSSFSLVLPPEFNLPNGAIFPNGAIQGLVRRLNSPEPIDPGALMRSLRSRGVGSRTINLPRSGALQRLSNSFKNALDNNPSFCQEGKFGTGTYLNRIILTKDNDLESSGEIAEQVPIPGVNPDELIKQHLSTNPHLGTLKIVVEYFHRVSNSVYSMKREVIHLKAQTMFDANTQDIDDIKITRCGKNLSQYIHPNPEIISRAEIDCDEQTQININGSCIDKEIFNNLIDDRLASNTCPSPNEIALGNGTCVDLTFLNGLVRDSFTSGAGSSRCPFGQLFFGLGCISPFSLPRGSDSIPYCPTCPTGTISVAGSFVPLNSFSRRTIENLDFSKTAFSLDDVDLSREQFDNILRDTSGIIPDRLNPSDRLRGAPADSITRGGASSGFNSNSLGRGASGALRNSGAASGALRNSGAASGALRNSGAASGALRNTGATSGALRNTGAASGALRNTEALQNSGALRNSAIGR